VFRGGWARVGRNLSLAFVNFLLGPVIVLPISAFAAAHALGLRPAWWNVVFDLLILDLWIYGWHRLNHVLPFLWRFHEVHHRDEMLDATSALRFHFGEVALSALVRGLMILVFAIPLQSVVAFETLVVLAAIFQHSNLRLPQGMERALAMVIVTPGLHWVHHHAQRDDTDSNYATVLSVWDLLFKSRSPNRRTDGMALGVEGEADLPLVRLLTRPFWR
jgi:sterol desaturase/sphingolipid hydroxylase (fatty acid hydroxylase superfamily)